MPRSAERPKNRPLYPRKEKHMMSAESIAIHEAAWIGSMKRRVKRTAARNSGE